jgi:hypothetical protein
VSGTPSRRTRRPRQATDETPRRTFVRGRDRRLDLEPLLGNSRSFTTHGDGARDQCLGCRRRSAGSASTRALPSQRPIFLSATEILANGWKMTPNCGKSRRAEGGLGFARSGRGVRRRRRGKKTMPMDGRLTVSRVFASFSASQPCRDLRGIPGREGMAPRSDGVQPWLAWRHGQPGKRNSAALKTLREWLLKLDVQERQRLSFFNAR